MNIYINPAFHRHQDEAFLVGRLLSGFGELEFLVLENARRATNNVRMPFLRAMYRLRATSARLSAADAFIRPVCETFALEGEYEIISSAISHCLKIRIQFSHCNWGDDKNFPDSGLFFIDLETAFEDPEDHELHWRHVDVTLLTKQYKYFVYTLESLRWINRELMIRQAIVQGRLGQNPQY